MSTLVQQSKSRLPQCSPSASPVFSSYWCRSYKVTSIRTRLLGSVSHRLRNVVAPEHVFHVNVLELRTVLRAIIFFDLHSLFLCIFTDEMVRYTPAACRTRSLPMQLELLSLLSELQPRNLFFQVFWVPTALNVVADALSRMELLHTEQLIAGRDPWTWT